MLLLLRSRDTTKSSTTLRAVPENTQNEKDVQSVEQETKTQGHSPVDDNKSQSVTSATNPPKSKPIWRKKPIRKLTGTRCSSKKTKSVERNASFIGTYKDGKIQWQRGGKVVAISSDKISQGEHKHSKSNANVAVPSGRCNDPLPPLPFFDSSVDGLRSKYSISPSLTSHSLLRGSTASPSVQSPPPQPTLRRSRRTIGLTSVPEPRPTQRPKSATEMISTSMCSGSIYSQDSSASSLRSYSSSETSLEADAISKPDNPQSPNTASKADASSNNDECHRKAPPIEPPRRYTHQSSSPENGVSQATCGPHAIYNTPHNTGTRGPKIECNPKWSGSRQNVNPSPRLGLQTQAAHPAGPGHGSETPCSPTLSEAECDLHQQLASFESISDLRAEEKDRTPLAETNLFRWEIRSPSAEDGSAHIPRAESTLSDSLDAPPPLPRKSSRRQSAARNPKLSRLPQNHIASQVRRGRPRASKTLKLMIPMYRRASVDVVFSQLPIEPDEVKSTKTLSAGPIISPAGAETVILNILQHLDHFDDLFAAALINHGFYRVYKRHELDLIKSTLQAMSPPAWEFREIAFPGHDRLHAEDLEMTRPEEEYTPATYLQLQKRDIQAIRAIKLEILEKCQSFIRPEITAALLSTDPLESARVDDALWRIWTFCIIFGLGKGREDDLVAQMDWLNGGALAHQETCTFSMSGTDLMNDTLVGMSESFGKGNEGGLTAEQLFDIMELWNCLAVLLQSFEGRTVQARQAGIYDNTDIRGGDIDGEEMMLDEWCYYLLTFGPAAVLKLTGPYHPSDPKGFTIAAENGWVNWKPPAPGNTRRKFLREAASRIYEDKIANTYAEISTRDVQRQQSRIRIQQHISELRQRRTSSDQPPAIHMSQERPMSDWDTVIKNLTRPPVHKKGSTGDIVTHVPTLRSSMLISTDGQSVSELPTSRTPSPPRRTFAQPLLPTPTASTVATPLDHRSVVSNLTRAGEHPPLPHWPRTAEVHPSSPSVSTYQSNRDLYTLGSVTSIGSPPCRTVAQPLLPTPSTTTASNAPDWQAYMIGHPMPSVPEDAPSHHPLSASPAPPHLVSAPPNHYAFHHRNGSRESDLSSPVSPRSGISQQHLRQRSIYSTPSHEHTAEKAIYRIVEMGFTPEQAREALRLTDLGSGLRVDRAVELLLSRQA